MDWILISNCMSEGFSFFMISLLCGAAILGIRTGMYHTDQYKKHSNDNNLSYAESDEKATELAWSFYFEHFKKVVFSSIAIGVISLLGFIPQILVKTNIDKVKLRYTDMEVVKKIEGGTLQVVEKLEKLIDKGIESIGESFSESVEQSK